MGIFIYPEREAGKKETMLRLFLHYLEVNAVVLGCGIRFEWFYIDNPPMVIGMVVMIAVIFLLVSFVIWKHAKRTALLMNRKLREYQEIDFAGDPEEDRSKNS